MILPIYVEPQPILREPTATIPEITPEIRELAASMRETMHAAKGIGLAAPQVGKGVAICVIEISEERDSESTPFTALLNPKILWRSQRKAKLEEGCLSIPSVYGVVKRPESVTVRYTDLEGKEREETAHGLFARVIQHEVDHLKGVLFTDYVPEAHRTFRDAPEYLRL